ncbi:hypothetical protein IP76_09310 [Rhizobium sp. AAP43]|nr:hypothetical protein IP76_09310 [Rhizobium sp. AAP43]
MRHSRMTFSNNRRGAIDTPEGHLWTAQQKRSNRFEPFLLDSDVSYCVILAKARITILIFPAGGQNF